MVVAFVVVCVVRVICASEAEGAGGAVIASVVVRVCVLRVVCALDGG